VVASVRVRLGKSLKNPPPQLLPNPRYAELVSYLARGDVDLGELERLVERVNEELKAECVSIRIRRAPPWSEGVDYILVLTECSRRA